MNNLYFPIKTSTACQLKWTWSTVNLSTGKTKSCCKTNGDTITADTFDQFHNTPGKVLDREIMLAGQWPGGGCEYCEKIETSGGFSDRQLHQTIPYITPPELQNNPLATTVTPRILEIYFDNLCNMSCIYCNAALSSQIHAENLRFNIVDDSHTFLTPLELNNITAKFWEWLQNNHHVLRRLHVLGGEPFYQPAFDRCLEFFDKNPNTNLELNVVSNIMMKSDRFKEKIGRIRTLLAKRKIARFDLTVSIDGWGPEQEYIRHGLDMDQWRENFEYAVSQKWMTIHVNQTLTSLIMPTIPALLSYINQQSVTRKIGHYFSTTIGTPLLELGMFGPGFFDKHFEEILRLMPAETAENIAARDVMQGIQQQYATSPRDSTKLRDLGQYLDSIDHRRNLNWRLTFPWLEKEINNVV
jgi:hypothetical protein